MFLLRQLGEAVSTTLGFALADTSWDFTLLMAFPGTQQAGVAEDLLFQGDCSE